MRVLLLITCLLACRVTLGASYFVDFATGSDANSGTSTNAPWQHCPGDGNATGAAASATLSAGDVVTFKGGVVYNGSPSGAGGNPITWSGASGNPIMYRGLSDWGTGRAVLNGTTGGVTNGTAFLVNYGYGGGNFLTITGFEIRNYGHAAVLSYGNSTVVSNNIIHHLGYYPWVDGNGHGYAFYAREASDPTCVSNVLYDMNETAFYAKAPLTNGIIWGNEIYWVEDHAIIGGFSAGYTLLAYNRIHDQTNAVTHDDAMQWMYFGEGTNVLIVANNVLWNNAQNVFLNSQANNGTAFIYNNRILNQQSFGGTENDKLGDDGYYNGIVVNTQEYPWNSLYIFNNTFALMNSGSAGLNVTSRGTGPPGTNVFWFNNLLYQSFANVYPQPGSLLNVYAGYCAETNTLRGNWLCTNEVNSVYGNIQFANLVAGDLPGSDLHLASGSVGIGTGTNLSVLVPANTFSFLPSRYQIDPTKDAAGVSRGAVWDVGALQGEVTPAAPIANSLPSSPPGKRRVAL